MTVIELDADRALFDGKLQGLIAAFYENERPLSGLIGLLDWRFQGAISRCVREGAVTGKAGECTYMPIERTNRIYHLFLVGAGPLPRGRKRGLVPDESLQILSKNLAALRIPEIGVSRSDFGDITEEMLAKQLKGIPLWIVP